MLIITCKSIKTDLCKLVKPAYNFIIEYEVYNTNLRALIKLWKKRSQPVPGSPSSKRLRLDADFESNEEEIITSPFLGQEEIIPVSSNKSNRSREEILQILASFKSKIINSILTSTPLSQLHSQLHPEVTLILEIYWIGDMLTILQSTVKRSKWISIPRRR